LPKMLYWRKRPPCVTVGRNSATGGAPSMPPPLILAFLSSPTTTTTTKKKTPPAHSSKARAQPKSSRLTLSSSSPLDRFVKRGSAGEGFIKEGAAAREEARARGRCCCWPATATPGRPRRTRTHSAD
jgi:hypothetical protein